MIHSTGSAASTSREDLPAARSCIDYSMHHMGLYPNTFSLSPPPLTSAVSFQIPHHMQQPYLLHPLNPSCHRLSPHHLPFFKDSSEFLPQITSYQPSHFTPSPLTPSPLTPTSTSVDFPVLVSSTQQPFQCFPHPTPVSMLTAMDVHSLPPFTSLTNSGCLSSHIVGEASGNCCWPPPTSSSSPPSSSSSPSFSSSPSLFSSSLSSQQMLP